MKSKQNGITLIALSITIVVLLILASVSIATLTGDSGVVDRANDAKVESEIDTEKDILDVATMGALQRSRKGEIEKKYLQEELNINPGKDKYELTGEETFVVTFKESGRKYKIYNNGEVSKINDNSETIEIETSKVTKDESGNIEAETLLTGTKAYIQINVKELEGYSISTQPSTPYKIDKNGEYDFTIIAKKGDEEINKEYKMKVGNYVDNPSSWIDFGGNSHIEFGSDSINQEDFHSNYTIGAKVKLKVDDIKKKNYMGVFGNHSGNAGVKFQFYKNTADIDISFKHDISWAEYDNKWTDIVRKYDGKTTSLYIDGELKASYENDSLIMPYEGFNIGTSILSTDRQMIGQISCLKIWNTALTDEEVMKMDLFQEGVNVGKDNVYKNINLKSKTQIEGEGGTFVGSDYKFVTP